MELQHFGCHYNSIQGHYLGQLSINLLQQHPCCGVGTQDLHLQEGTYSGGINATATLLCRDGSAGFLMLSLPALIHP